MDGQNPVAGLIQGTDGNLYGTTYNSVFKVTLGGTLTAIYNFCSQPNCTDGEGSTAGLVQATDGNFYGTTEYGGASGVGTVYEVTPGGILTTLHSFDETDGFRPLGGLVQATNGTFYGTTYYGGDFTCDQQGCGTIFSLSTGLGPFVKAVPAAAGVGARVGILGTDLGGATSVTFNGTQAQFTIPLPTVILTHVPAGATTGYVTVTTPTGTLTSNVPFQVVQ
jgi:uncharacterized repeat protein (TIGR03803 family)